MLLGREGEEEEEKEEQESGLDGDAPEQVTLSTGREEAQKLRKEEREHQTRVRAEAKLRRQKIVNENKKNVFVSDEQQGPPLSSDMLEEAGGKPVQDEQESKSLKSVRSELLDKSIVDFLSAQEKNVVAGGAITQGEDLSKSKGARKRKKNGAVNSSSRFKIVFLEDDQPTLAKFQNALEFKQGRLYGEHVHRSHSMLPKPRAV